MNARTWDPRPTPAGCPGIRIESWSGFSPASTAIRCTVNSGLPLSRSGTAALVSRSVTASTPPTMRVTPFVSILNRIAFSISLQVDVTRLPSQTRTIVEMAQVPI